MTQQAKLYILINWIGWLILVAMVNGCRTGASTQIATLPPLIREAPPAAAQEALTAVSQSSRLIPPRDLVTLTQQLRGLPVERTARPTAESHQVGDIVTFWAKNLADNSNRQLAAQLVYRSDALNMWVETGARFDETAVPTAAHLLETRILPTNQEFFGQEWSPGVDGDARINILHLKKLEGVGIAYFSATDEYVTAVNPYSNQREMFYVSLADVQIGSDAYLSTIAHEFQHMIAWHVDPNEDAWLGEGLSELAIHLNGYPTHREATYAQNPDIPLTNLSQSPDVIANHYAAAFLFTRYFLDRFGHEATQALTRHQENGPASFSQVLNDLNTGLTFDDLFADWLAANYLAGIDRSADVPGYTQIDLPKLTAAKVRHFPATITEDVSQYGADYVTLQADGPITVNFTGTQQVQSVGTAAHSGRFFWISYPADVSDMRLTRPVDLSGVPSATLSFWTWYDLEAGWDYGYVTVSPDNGRSWALLAPSAATLANPVGNSFGPGFTGRSQATGSSMDRDAEPVWIEQHLDLTPYAGRSILLRFQVITDDAVHERGLAIDDVAIPELGWQDDMETGENGWQAEGFIRMTDVLPQEFMVQVILVGETAVHHEHLPLTSTQYGQWLLPLGEIYSEATLIIAATTPFTTQRAVYDLTITGQ